MGGEPREASLEIVVQIFDRLEAHMEAKRGAFVLPARCGAIVVGSKGMIRLSKPPQE